MLRRKKKICNGCKKEKFIWGNRDGKKYCSTCYWKSDPSSIPRIKPVSDKRRKENRIYSLERKKYLKKNPFCKARLPGCTGVATDIHHLISGSSRSKYFLEISTWKGVCRNCHDIIHNKLSAEEAVNLGLKMKDTQKFDSLQELVEHMQQGDQDCSIPIGTKIEKTNSEPGDLKTDGVTGIVMGSLSTIEHGEAYLVTFDGDLQPTFILGKKIKPYEY